MDVMTAWTANLSDADLAAWRVRDLVTAQARIVETECRRRGWTYTLSDHVSDEMTEPEWAGVIGRTAVYTTADGWDRIVGVVEAPTRWSSGYPIIRFPDGRWGRCDDVIDLIP